MTLAEMIDFLEELSTTPGTSKEDGAKLCRVSSRLKEFFRLRGLFLNCPDDDEEMAQKLLKCLDLKSGS